MSILLGSVMLLQLMGTTMVVVDFQLRRTQITEMFCVNKAKPEMKCNGQCHLKKRVTEQSEQESKSTLVNIEPMHPAVLTTFAIALSYINESSVQDLCDYSAGLSKGRPKGVFHPPQV